MAARSSNTYFLFFRHSTYPQPGSSLRDINGAISSATKRIPYRREKVGNFSLSLPRLLHSSIDRAFRFSHCQIPLIVPHSSSREAVLKEFSFRAIKSFSLGFCSFGQNHVDADVGNEIDVLDYEKCKSDSWEAEIGGIRLKSSADPNEVSMVCKVIDELLALDRNMEAVLDECKINLSQDLVVDVLEHFRLARKPAFRFFKWAGEDKPNFSHNSVTYNAMMIVLGRTRQYETMVALLDEMGEKQLLTMETFTIAIKAFAAAKERKKAVGIFELMKKHKYKVGADTINLLLDSLGKAKLGKESQALFDKLKERFTPDLRTYSVLLNGWCRVKNLTEAGRVWNEMIDKGFKPDVIAHNTMLEGLLRSNKKSDAIKFFDVMKAKGPKPNARSYTILIHDFCKHKKMKTAFEYFDEMLSIGCQPDAAIYTCLITGLGNLKRMDMVQDLLKEMKEKGCLPDGRTYNSLIKLKTSQRLPDDAVKIYKMMIHEGIEPSIHTYNMMMKSYFQIRNYEMGSEVWNEMIRKGCCPDDNSYTVFIGGLISLGRSEEASKYIEEMIAKGMKAPQLDYNKFAADFSKAGKPYILEELAQKMKFCGKFEVSNVFARWAEMMKKRVKNRNHISTPPTWQSVKSKL